MKIEIKRTKILISVIFLIVTLASSFAGYVYGQSGSTTFTISSGVYPGSPSYTIYVEDGTYKAKNAYGYISWSSTESTVIINNAMDSLTTGTIQLKSGTYTINRLTSNKESTTLSDRFPLFVEDTQSIKIIGEPGVVLRAGDGENVGIFYVEIDGYLELENMELDGNYAAQTFSGEPIPDEEDLYCVYHNGMSDDSIGLVMENVWVHDATTDNIAVVRDGTYIISNVKSTHAQYDSLIVGGETTNAHVLVTNWISDNSWVELRTSGKIYFNGAYMQGDNSTTPLLSISSGSPVVEVNNFIIYNGQIQSDSSGYPTVLLSNGFIDNGRIVLFRCNGAIVNVNQTGSSTNGLELWGCQNLAVQSSSFSSNTQVGILLVNISSTVHNVGLTFDGVTVIDNTDGGMQFHDDCTIQISNFVGVGTGITNPLINVLAGYTPTIFLNNYKLTDGRIVCSGYTKVSLNNGEIINGHIILYRASGSISQLYQVGTSGTNGIEMRGSQNMTISNCNLQSNYRAIFLLSDTIHSTNNQFSNIFAQLNGVATIYETDANQDYNTYSNINGRGDLWYILTSGANSHVSSSWNQTSWIP